MLKTPYFDFSSGLIYYIHNQLLSIRYDIESVDESINSNSNPSIIKMNIEDLFEYEK